MILREENIEFNFSDAIGGYKFDDASHGLSYCMKSVDFIVELQDSYLFIEIKDPSNPNARSQDVEKFKQKKCKSGELCNDLKTKFRDTFLYKWAEKTQDKPIYYLCLITLDDASLLTLNDNLKKHLPIEGVPQSWSRSIAKACHMLNIETWNKNFPKWQVTRL